MSESILESVKKMIGADTDYDIYDDDFKSLINSSLATMYQLGAGQDQFVVTGSSETWDDFSQDKLLQAFAQDYIRLTIKITWDPDPAGFVLSARQEMRKELTERIKIHCSQGSS